MTYLAARRLIRMLREVDHVDSSRVPAGEYPAGAEFENGWCEARTYFADAADEAGLPSLAAAIRNTAFPGWEREKL